jgi:C-terminal processing protease CtpA/Prc
MKYNTRLQIFQVLAMLGLIVLTSCEKDPDLPRDTLILNNWIWEGMNDFYLWEAHIPVLNPNAEPDSRQFFEKILYKDDRDSRLFEDYEAVMAVMDGVEVAVGMSVYPMMYTETQVVAFVEYVVPGTPAADSGISRGDIILTIDGQILTKTNYYSLYYQNTATFGFGEWDGNSINPNGREITLNASVLKLNPVIYDEVIEYQGQKIGYLVYTLFSYGENDEWLSELNGVFEMFRSEGVSDVVMDLRYNPGGDLSITAYIASTLGPVSAMEDSAVFVDMVWNERYNQYWAGVDLDNDGTADGLESKQLRFRLPKSDLNLDLSRIYFLTTGGSASASESLMVGLYPYMDVIQVGTTTYGKCYASILVDDWEDPKRHNWAMRPIVIKYSNAEGYTDFVDGIEPDHLVEDNLLYAKPFGSLEDPLLAKALEEITGISPLARKSVQAEISFKPFRIPLKQVPELMIELPAID